jgi:hypothetical protein
VANTALSQSLLACEPISDDSPNRIGPRKGQSEYSREKNKLSSYPTYYYDSGPCASATGRVG